MIPQTLQSALLLVQAGDNMPHILVTFIILLCTPDCHGSQTTSKLLDQVGVGDLTHHATRHPWLQVGLADASKGLGIHHLELTWRKGLQWNSHRPTLSATELPGW